MIFSDYRIYDHVHEWHYHDDRKDSYCPLCGFWRSVVDLLKTIDRDI